ncbi:hypothetical protein [Sphingobacterium sp. UBA6308]|uniref:hypothetical protein n=1 Tax=Sphingobacterium sp. UBA6308 TaxID=1947508 RepID=UPI002579A52F|nr:hypothetical protein [Sphingobacterium sp. UBA6308]
MIQLVFGTKGQIRFSSELEFFEALGFLCKNDRTTSIGKGTKSRVHGEAKVEFTAIKI